MSAVPKSLRRHAVSTGEYLRMGEAGVFAREARLELIAGEILEMAPISSAHAGTVIRLIRLFGRLAGDQAMLSVQNPLVVNDHSVPQPDVVLLKPRADDYTTSHPVAEDALLVVEVADTTLAFDLGTKAALYSRGGIAELWVVDLQDRSVRVFREPSASGYRASFTVVAGQSVSCLALPAITLAPADLVPAP
jgi:Uma2 family endonuclease